MELIGRKVVKGGISSDFDSEIFSQYQADDWFQVE